MLEVVSVVYCEGKLVPETPLNAACLENNIPELYTEDIADNFRKEGLEIINPF